MKPIPIIVFFPFELLLIICLFLNGCWYFLISFTDVTTMYGKTQDEIDNNKDMTPLVIERARIGARRSGMIKIFISALLWIHCLWAYL